MSLNSLKNETKKIIIVIIAFFTFQSTIFCFAGICGITPSEHYPKWSSQEKYNLARMYGAGEGGLLKDEVKAAELYQKAALQGTLLLK